ncbi:NUDIX hydrolase [Corynebacterium sp. A21]|uniref:NUDIX hydrolase n=1 Tax=Corynebacterium sp. A21 TaxID=3457318 RepID=UPI003FD48242
MSMEPLNPEPVPPDLMTPEPQFIADQPGQNIELSPEVAPLWMSRLLRRIAAGSVHASLRAGGLERSTAPDDKRRAAVLMLFSGTETSVELPNDAAVLLTHRSPRMRSHSGQIAFPGGQMDTTDINAVDCALREAWEETGLDRHSLTPVAELDEVHIRASGYPVHPILGHWHSPSRVGVVSPQEADEVFQVPIFDLIDPANRLMVHWGDWRGPAFHVNDYIVWGFTGMLLSSVLHHAGWEEPWDHDTNVDLRRALASSRNNERSF